MTSLFEQSQERRAVRKARRAEGGSLFGGGTETPIEDPKVSPVVDPDIPTRMPDPEDPAERERVRLRAALKSRAGGRLSTILSDPLRRRVGTHRQAA